MFDLNSFNHFTEIQIRFKDIDMQGHVNNANHLTYAEIARVEYFKKVREKKRMTIEEFRQLNSRAKWVSL